MENNNPSSGVVAAMGRAWWLVLLRGIAAIVFGVLAWAWPGATLITLTLFWGAYALVDGVAALWSWWHARGSGKAMWQMVLIGLLGIAAGLFTFISPGITAITLLLLIAVWAIVNGVFQIAAAIKLRKEIDNEWLMILSGALSVVFGGLMIASPGAGAMAVLWIIGAFAVAYGVLMVLFAFKLRNLPTAAPASS